MPALNVALLMQRLTGLYDGNDNNKDDYGHNDNDDGV